jgi:hypothetical protein
MTMTSIAPALENDDVQTVSLRYSPRPWALELHEALATHKNVVCVAPRRSGKSTAAAAAICMAALAKPGRYAIVLQTKTHGRLIYWAILKDMLADIPGVTFHEGDLRVEFATGGEIIFFGAADGDGASVRGLGLSGAICDEAQLLTEASIAGAILPALFDRQGFLLAIGTPAEPSTLGLLFEKASFDDSGEWKALHFTIHTVGVFTPKQIEQLKAEALNPAIWKAEFECDLTAGLDRALIPLSALVEATKRKAPARFAETSLYREAPRIVGVDCGGDGLEADQSAIVCRIGPLILPPVLVDKEDLDQLPLRVASAARTIEADLIAVDSTGGHASHLLPRLQEMAWTPIPIVFSASSTRPDVHANKRAELFARLAEFIQKPDTILPDDRALFQELASVTYFHNARGLLALDPKAKIRTRLGRSPDRADALALTMVGDYMAPPRAIPSFQRGGLQRYADGARYQSDFRQLEAGPACYVHDPFG